MTLRERILAVIGFRVVPTTVVVSVVYLLLFFATLVYQDIPQNPSRKAVAKAGVNLEGAWADLQVVS
jgi:hypothetical protein